MPLIKSASKSAQSQNIKEMMDSFRASGKLGTSKPASDKKAQDQAIAISYANARKYAHKAAGGPTATPWYSRSAAHQLVHEGLIHSPVPGRTDKINVAVPKGAYVIPADVVSGMRGAQGNTLAGSRKISGMFKMPKMSAPKMQSGVPRLPSLVGNIKKPHFAKGGADDDHINIIIAGGEHVVPPEAIIAKYGSLEKGHASLDAFVKSQRKHNIKVLKKLPGPSK